MKNQRLTYGFQLTEPGQSLFCYSENILYVCSALHTQGRDDARQYKAGFFYPNTLLMQVGVIL